MVYYLCMPNVRCLICRAEFYAKPSWLKAGFGKYCSVACQRKGQKNGRFVSCFICRKKVYRTQKGLRGSKSRKYFCSKSCQTVWRNTMVFVGSRHPNWKHGFSNDYYRRILSRTKRKKVCQLCETTDSRILVVHHVDHNHFNNKLTNLMWLCQNCHFLIHHYKEERKRLMETLV